MADDFTEQQRAAYKELGGRLDSLNPNQRAAYDELGKRMNKPAEPSGWQQFTGGLKAGAQFVSDIGMGINAEVNKMVFTGGDLIRRATGQNRVINEPDVQRNMTPPDTLGGKLGAMAEPVLETMAMPEMKATEAPRLLKTGETVLRETLPSLGKRAAFEGAKMGTQSAFHGDDPTIGAVLGAAGPALGALLQRAAPAVKGSAAWLYEKALNPTTKVTKTEARNVVPELLEKKFWATTFPRLQGQAEAELAQAETQLESAFDKSLEESKNTFTATGRYRTVHTPGTPATGPVIDLYPEGSAQQTQSVGFPERGVGPQAAPQTGGTSGTTQRVYETSRNALDLKPVLDNLKSMLGEYSVKGMQPTSQASTTYRQILDQYNRLKQFGTHVGLEDARKLRQILDRPLGEKGMFAIDPKWASLDRVQRRAGDALRAQINDTFPELAKENANYSFWRNVNHVIEETSNRKVGQTALLTALGTGTGAVGGMIRGDDAKDTLRDAVLIGGATALVRSPGFRTLSAVQLNRLSEYLQSRDVEGFIRVAGVLLRPKEDTGARLGK